MMIIQPYTPEHVSSDENLVDIPLNPGWLMTGSLYWLIIIPI